MKTTFLLFAILMSALQVGAQQAPVYQGSCFHDAYLPTYSCDGAAIQIYRTNDCSTQEAFLNCRLAGGRNCVFVGRRHIGWTSLTNGDLNRVGYKRCQVITYVRSQ